MKVKQTSKHVADVGFEPTTSGLQVQCSTMFSKHDIRHSSANNTSCHLVHECPHVMTTTHNPPIVHSHRTFTIAKTVRMIPYYTGSETEYF